MRFLAVLLSAGLALGAQSPAPPAEPARSDVVFSVTSTLVQIDAVVLDKQGRQVTNLGSADFEVLIDGRPQKITNLSYVRVTPEPSEAPAVRPTLPGQPPLPPQPEVRREQVRRTIVLVMDDLNMGFQSVASVRRAMHKFVEQQLQPGDMVAVCRTASGSSAMQTFTTDRRILLSVVDHLRWYPDQRLGMPSDMATRAVSQMLSARTPELPGLAAMFHAANTTGSLMTLQHIVDALRDLPGRKSVVLFSDGLTFWIPPQPTRDPPAFGTPGDDVSGALDASIALKVLTDSANRSGTVIYTLNTTGLVSLMPGADAGLDSTMAAALPGTASPSAQDLLNSLQVSVQTGHNISQLGLASVAELTGGLAYSNGNDLNYGLARVLEDQKGYYLIAFHPDDPVLDSSHGLRFNQVKVRVHGAGLRVRSRTGFYGQTDEQERPKNLTPLEQLRASMLSPFRSSDIRVRATPLYSQLTAQGPQVRNLIHIDVRDLEFVPQYDGSSNAYVDLLAVAVGAGDKTVGAVAKPYVVVVPAGGMELARDRGIAYALDLAVPNPGPYQFRMAVRDKQSGKVGSASQFLEIPDLERVRMALTSIVLGRDTAAPESELVARLTPARRQFRQADVMRYFCLLERAGKSRPLAPGAVQAQVRVFHDDKQIYSGSAPVRKAEDGRPAVFGRLQIKGAIPPGEYYLQISARVLDGKKEIAAAQWTDFEVVE